MYDEYFDEDHDLEGYMEAMEREYEYLKESGLLDMPQDKVIQIGGE